jgi:succinoglycan biosynthesis protein ExoL
MEKKSILFLLSHQPHPRFIKQINFLSKNNNVSVIYYQRPDIKDLESEYISNVSLSYNLGEIPNGKYLKRINIYYKTIKTIKKILSKNNYDVLVVNNIDTLFLYNISTNQKTTKIMQISDLRSHTYTNNIKSFIIRIFEKILFKSVNKLIITSPKFFDYYKRIYKGEYFLLENKPLKNMIPKRIQNEIKNEKTIIGIVGQLMQINPYLTLFEKFKNNNSVEIHIHGKGKYQKTIEEYSLEYNNILYFGEYNFFKDSAEIYTKLDLLYMPYDTTNGSLNNKVALPNKLYEAMYFKIPIITSFDSYLGEIVNELRIGKTIKCCDEDSIIEDINFAIKNKNIYLNNLHNLDDNLFLGDNDYIELEKYINE